MTDDTQQLRWVRGTDTSSPGAILVAPGAGKRYVIRRQRYANTGDARAISLVVAGAVVIYPRAFIGDDDFRDRIDYAVCPENSSVLLIFGAATSTVDYEIGYTLEPVKG